MRTRPLASADALTVRRTRPEVVARLLLALLVAAGAALLFAAGFARAGTVPAAPTDSTTAVSPPAEDRAGRPHHGDMDEHFKQLDKDGNGSLSKAELEQGAPRMAKRFDDLDANKDGSVSREELRAAHEKMRAGMRERKGERFDAADADGNGSLSKAEVDAKLKRLADNFDAIDTDHNGELSRAELAAWRNSNHPR